MMDTPVSLAAGDQMVSPGVDSGEGWSFCHSLFSVVTVSLSVT